MRIYLREEPEVVAGMEGEYARAIEEIVYPILAESPVMTMRPVGAFRVDATYGAWPNFVLLWCYEDGWASYAAGRRVPRSGVKDSGQLTQDSRMIEYVNKAGKFRQRSMERLIHPVWFSPLPPPLPERTSPGSIFLDQRISVRPGVGADFLKAFESHVIPAARDAGVTLELVGRTAGRPFEFCVTWSLPSWEAWASFQDRRGDGAVDGCFFPGMHDVWSAVDDIEEKTLFPMSFSPLGGATTERR